MEKRGKMRGVGSIEERERLKVRERYEMRREEWNGGTMCATASSSS